ncbi:hypothetical protein LOTGIDRAFT_227386 [Lottia gigantea]|uniref:Large ribosomal subunit protein mL39 n=1 Tax=Lottia gigantea TaxID=225164 RepID=V4ACN9_LOTGI|nr:hypothetical protein LOTGIDRAFT_227386 [Lottia gigantea]ESO94612.1 hypothetical protein LOTGIDRAFT_227386 [Lottia gigantea]
MAASIARRKSLLQNHFLKETLKRCYSACSQSTNTAVKVKRNEIFDEEKLRQQNSIIRIEKINVDVRGPPEDCSLLMNKGISTPYHCAMHIQEILTTRSALAFVNSKPWDMHRPLTEDCTLEFSNFEDNNPAIANNAFWRSCTLVLGNVLETAFQDKYYIELVSFPQINIKTGSFVYDVDLKMPDWKPTSMELNSLSTIGYRLHYKDLQFERLTVDVSIAREIFTDNQYKHNQISDIAQKSKSGKSVTLYRVGDFIDMTGGPCISSTGQIGRFNVTAIHPIEDPVLGRLHRVQGVAIPTQTEMHYWTYNLLCQRASKLNPLPLPSESKNTDEESEVKQLVS